MTVREERLTLLALDLIPPQRIFPSAAAFLFFLKLLRSGSVTTLTDPDQLVAVDRGDTQFVKVT